MRQQFQKGVDHGIHTPLGYLALQMPQLQAERVFFSTPAVPHSPTVGEEKPIELTEFAKCLHCSWKGKHRKLKTAKTLKKQHQ